MVSLKKKTTFRYEVKIKKDKCKGCYLCVINCPVNCLKMSSSLNSQGVVFAYKLKDKKCIGCGFCFLICPDCCVEITKFEGE